MTMSNESFLDKCGCEWHAGQWFPCTIHPEKCDVCQEPLPRGMQGICAICLDVLEVVAR